MVNYNDLYEVLRKEKYGDGLQLLSKGFILEYSSYIKELSERTSQSSDLFAESVAKVRKQMENSVSIFNELRRIRKKKLLNLVFVAVETGIMKRDYENMLPFEKDVFDKLVKAFEDGDKELGKLLAGNDKNEKSKLRMIMMNQNVDEFVDMNGNLAGPFVSGEIVNLNSEVSDVLVSGGKASYVEEE